jgi:hypothetical protein
MKIVIPWTVLAHKVVHAVGHLRTLGCLPQGQLRRDLILSHHFLDDHLISILGPRVRKTIEQEVNPVMSPALWPIATAMPSVVATPP